MKSTWLLLLLVLVQLFRPDLFGQQELFIVSKPRLSISQEYLVIDYDILKSNSTDLFTIWLEITNSSGYIIPAKSIIGDVGKDISGGLNKRILWNLEQDSIYVDEELFVEIRAELQIPVQVEAEPIKKETIHKEPAQTESIETERAQTEEKLIPPAQGKTIGKAAMVFSSLALPGLGRSIASRGKPHWLMGVAGYGCLAGSIYLNREAVASYDQYKSVTNENQGNLLFDQAVNQNRNSKILAYSALGIWVLDFVLVLATPSNSGRPISLIPANRLELYPVYNPVFNTGMVSLCYRF